MFRNKILCIVFQAVEATHFGAFEVIIPAFHCHATDTSCITLLHPSLIHKESKELKIWYPNDEAFIINH